MKYKTHIAGGLALGYSALSLIDNFNVINVDEKSYFIISVGFVIGALIPDIERKGSYISNKNKFTSFIIRLFIKHREFTHSVYFVGLLLFLAINSSLANHLALSLFIASISVGVASHILLDMFTVPGVALFSPFSDKRYSFVKGVDVPDFVALLICLFIIHKNIVL